jgi:uncharacterized protein YukJ
MAAGVWRMSRPHAEVDGISVILGRSGRPDRWRDTHAVVELWGAGRAGGRPKGRGGTDTPHYQVQLAAGDERYRIAVNVLSREHPSELLYLADESFHHPIVQELPSLPAGFTPLPGTPAGLALDLIRANLFDRTMLRAVPATAPGPDNDLADKLDHFVQRAAADAAARVYAFGQRWGPEPGTPGWSTPSARHPRSRR